MESPAPSPDGTAGAAVGNARKMKGIDMGSVRSRHSVHPLFDKFESRHVTQFLKQSFESDVAKRKAARSDRWFRLICVSLGLGGFAFLTALLLPERSDLYLRTLQGMGVFGAGLAAGYGIRACQSRHAARRRQSIGL